VIKKKKKKKKERKRKENHRTPPTKNTHTRTGLILTTYGRK